MTALANPRHEAFCQAYVRGDNAGNGSACYKAAFGTKSPKAAGVGASNLLKKTNIRARLNELQSQVVAIEQKAVEKAAEKLGITKERVLAELANIGFANMLDYVVPQADGTVKIDLSALDRAQAAAIVAVTSKTLAAKGSVKIVETTFKLADKKGALVDIAKLCGFAVPERMPGAQAPAEVNVNVRAELVDRPPRETYEEWNARRQRELAGKERLNKPKEGKGK